MANIDALEGDVDDGGDKEEEEEEEEEEGLDDMEDDNDMNGFDEDEEEEDMDGNRRRLLGRGGGGRGIRKKEENEDGMDDEGESGYIYDDDGDDGKSEKYEILEDLVDKSVNDKKDDDVVENIMDDKKNKKKKKKKKSKKGKKNKKKKHKKTTTEVIEDDIMDDLNENDDELKEEDNDDLIDDALDELDGNDNNDDDLNEIDNEELNDNDLEELKDDEDDDMNDIDDNDDDEFGEYADDEDMFDDPNNFVDDIEDDTLDINTTNTTNITTTGPPPFKFHKFWKQIKLRLVEDYDESNPYCYSEEDLREILWERDHPQNITNNTTDNTTVTTKGEESKNTTNDDIASLNTSSTLSIENKKDEDKKSKLIAIEEDKDNILDINITNITNTANTTDVIATNNTLNATEIILNVTNITTEAPKEIVNKSYCIQLQIEIIHKDGFGANQTWPFMEILQQNETYWNNLTERVNRKLKDVNYDYNDNDNTAKPKKIHKLFDFKRFTLYDNQSIDISMINVSEVSTGGKGRYRDNEELRYSLRSVWQFAPWIRNIYILTNGQVPKWLNLDNEKIWIVTHDDIYKNKSHLPTFASPSIEANIHRIPGLSNRFLYLNDDVMFGNDVYPDDFWKLDGTQFFFPSWEPPKCSEGCPNNWLHDGYCDGACNNEDCDWDGGDCLDANGTNTGSTSGGGGGDRGGGGGDKQQDRYCASGCPITWVGDKVCDRACQDKGCAYDGGDCGLDMMKENGVFGVELEPDTANGSVIELERDIMAFYVDFGNIFKKDEDKKEEDGDDKKEDTLTTTMSAELVEVEDPTKSPTAAPTFHPEENKIKTAQHDHKDMIRTAIITQAEKILAVILHPHNNIDEAEEVIFDIGGIKNGEEVHYVFTVHRDAPEKKLNIDSVKKKMEYILKGMNQTEIINVVIKEDMDDPKVKKQVYEWKNETVCDIKGLYERIESETEKDEDKRKKLKGVIYEKLFIFAGNNTVWLIESDDGLKEKLLDGYGKWMEDELERKVKEAEAAQNATKDANEYKAKQPTLPPYLFDDEFMYKYDDFFVGDGDNGYGADEYGMDQDYYDEYRDMNGFDDAVRRRRRNLLGLRLEEERYLLFGGGNLGRLDGRDRFKMLQRERYNEDEDYKIMIDLGLIDDQGHWKRSKGENDWGFLRDFKEDVLGGVIDEDEQHPILDRHKVDGYIDEKDSRIIKDDWIGNAKLSTMKKQAMRKLYEGDLIRIQRKLESVFKKNYMDIFPWVIKDLSLYIFYEKGLGDEVKSGKDNKRKLLLDTFGDSLRFVTRILNKNFGVDTRYVPAHMPHAIDKEILIELVDRFDSEYDATSSHRFRSGHDMQWSFSYFYYMMSVKYNFSDIDFIYNEWLDIDHDGILNDYELERMVNDVLVKEATKDTTDDYGSANDTIWQDFFHKALWNITRQLHDLTYWHPLQITVYSVNYTTIIRDYLMKHYNHKKKFRYHKKELDDVEFYMIKDNPSEVKDRLNNMYNKKPKFMCLNDDLPHDRDPSNETIATLTSFFHKYYPYPSPFEIVDKGEYHPYIRKDDMVKSGYWKNGWNLNNNKHYKLYNDKFQIRKALRNNLYKKHKLQIYYDHNKDIKNNVRSLYDKYINYKTKPKKKKRNDSNSDEQNIGNYSYHIDNDMPLPGEAFIGKEQIRTVFYQTIVRRFREYNWFIQFLALFIFCSIVVTVFLKIVDIIWYYLTVTCSWIFTNNPKLFACCKWFSFKSWFGSNKAKHSD